MIKCNFLLLKKQTYDSARLLALLMIWPRDVFSTSAMGALAPEILKNRLLAPVSFGHFNTVGKNCRC